MVYKIISNQTDKVYIGSTCQELSQRLAGHRRDYKRYLNGKHNYVSSFEIVKYPDAKIVLVQAYPDCQNSIEKRRYEQDWIDCYDCVNKRRSYISPELAKVQCKEWCENNREHIKNIMKENYENNKEERIIYSKEYYENNREKILEQNKQIVICECGAKLSRGSLSTHKKTSQQHQNYLNNLS